MKASTTILRGLNNIRASYILESELPDTAAVLLPPSDRRTAWKKIASNGWFVAAVCAVVAFGTLTGIVLAGRGGPGGITPPVGSQTTDTTAEQTEAPTEAETAPAVVYTEGLEFAPVDGEEGACYVVGIGKAKDRRIRIPETSPEGLTVKQIGYQAFAYNMNITEVILPDTVEIISDYAFIGCMSLKKVTVGEGLTSVKTYAFYQCTKLKDINLTTNHEIQTSAMYGTPWLDAHTDEFVIYGGNLIDYNGAGGDVVVPDGVKRIYGHAFADKSNITSVTIPDSCEWVVGAVFMNCSSLESLSIPSSVISFGGERLFEGCTSLHTLELPGVLEIVPWAFRDTTSITEVHMPNVQIIGYEAFKNCAGLTRFETAAQIIAYGCFSDCKNLRELVFLDGVQKLDDDFFKNCPALERIVLPSTVTAIGHISAISSEDLVIEYAGTAEDFAKIQMDEQTAALLLPYVQFTVSE